MNEGGKQEGQAQGGKASRGRSEVLLAYSKSSIHSPARRPAIIAAFFAKIKQGQQRPDVCEPAEKASEE